MTRPTTPDAALLTTLGAIWDGQVSAWYEPTTAPDGLLEPIPTPALRAACALTQDAPSTEALVLALASLDHHRGYVVRAYSDLAAVTADRDDYAAIRAAGPIPGRTTKERAEQRHARRESEALDQMLTPTPVTDAIRARLLTTLTERGVKLSGELNCAAHMRRLILSRREIQSVMHRRPDRASALRGEYQRLHEELSAAGVA